MRRNKFNKIRSKKSRKQEIAAAPQTQAASPSSSPFIRASVRAPGTAMLGLASVMLATNAMAQEALPTIDVETAGNGGGGYQATQSTLSRIPTPLRDTPQTVNVVPQQIIQEQRQTTMEDALRTVPGITFAAGEGGQQGDSPIIRGFAARGDLFRDGMRDPGWYTRDLFSGNTVEVYKGPSAFAFGRGATGGAINVVSKLPTFNAVPYLEGTVTGSTGPGIRAELDAAGTKGEVSGRIAALYQDVTTPTRDDVYTRRWGVAPSISANVDDKTRVTLSYIYQGEEGRPDYGFTFLPAPAYSKSTGALTNGGYYGNGAPTPPLPTARTTWFGVRGGALRDLTTTETHISTIKIEREISDQVKLANTTRYIDNQRYSLPTALRNFGTSFVTPNQDPNTLTIGRERRERWTNNTYLVNQTDLTAKFETWGIRHTLAAGMEFTNETRSQQRIDRCDPANAACTENVMNPYPIGSPTGGAQTVYNPINTGANNQAVFVSDQVKFNKYFELLGSIRYDRFSTVYDDFGTQTAPTNVHLARVDNLTSYRVGAVGHPTSNSSIYIAYGNSYNPSAELGTLTNASVASLAPEQTKTLEAGVKVDVTRELGVSGAIFRIEKTNLRVTDIANSTVSTLDGIARVDGVELAVVGKLTDQWSVFGGYSYLQSKILDTPDASLNGRELAGTPHHNFTVWSTYAVTPDWTIGGGAAYQSMAFATNNNVTYVPDYWKFDAMLAYKVTRNSTLQLNVYNLTDRLYYAQYSGGNVVPASGRWASLTYRYRFEPPPAVTPTVVK